MLYPQADVALALVVRGNLLLAVMNRPWGAFTFPMTKLRVLGPEERVEHWEQAALRAAAECLGPVPFQLRRKGDMAPATRFSPSGHCYKNYRYQVYSTLVNPACQAIGGVPHVWMPFAEFQNPLRTPVSPTAREAAAWVQAQARACGQTPIGYLST